MSAAALIDLSRERAYLRDLGRAFGGALVFSIPLLMTMEMWEQGVAMDRGRLLQYATPREILTAPATPFVRELIGTEARPFRLLSLSCVSDLVRSGEAAGPPVAPGTSLRDALALCLWSGREALPVEGGGVVTLDALRRAAAGEAAR